MGIRKFKPTTPSLRWTVLNDFSEITKEEPEKSLIVPLKKTGIRVAVISGCIELLILNGISWM